MNSLERVRNSARAFFPGIAGGKDVGAASDAELSKILGILKEVQSSMGPAPKRAEYMQIYDRRAFVALLSELMLGACNFCYWAGRANCLPAGGSANLMAEICYAEGKNLAGGELQGEPLGKLFSSIVQGTINRVAVSGLPLIDRRIINLREIAAVGEDRCIEFFGHLIEGRPLPEVMDELLRLLPVSFAGDIFLKRALLFFHQIYREFGLYSRDEMAKFPMPTDYQVPKMLEAYGALTYSPRLKDIIAAGEHLPSGSLMELEIRAGTMLIVDRLSELSGMTIGEIDWALWFTRKKVTTPYHLTVTTDY